jgi:hypothetical protein
MDAKIRNVLDANRKHSYVYDFNDVALNVDGPTFLVRSVERGSGNREGAQHASGSPVAK